MLCPNGTVKSFLVSLVEPVAYLKSELVFRAEHQSLSRAAASPIINNWIALANVLGLPEASVVAMAN